MATYGINFRPVAILVHILGVVVLAVTLAWVNAYRGGVNLFSSDPNQIFNAHPVILVGGYIFLSSVGILVFKTLTGTNRSNRKLIHLILQGVAFLFALLGVYAAYDFHVLKSIDHFYSFHSWLGIATLALFFIQWVVGFVSFWLERVKPKTRGLVLPWHVFLGLAAYVLMIGTAATGFFEKLTFLQKDGGVGRYATESMFVNSIAMVLVFFGLVTVLAAVIPASRQKGG